MEFSFLLQPRGLHRSGQAGPQIPVPADGTSSLALEICFINSLFCMLININLHKRGG